MRWPVLPFGNETHDRALAAGKKRRCFFASILQTFPMPSASDFREFDITSTTAPTTVPAARTIAVTVKPCFRKISFTLSNSSMLFLSLHDLCSEPCKLFFMSCHSGFVGFSFRQSVFVIDYCFIFLFLAFKLGFLAPKVVE